jgi:hypothetical protein
MGSSNPGQPPLYFGSLYLILVMEATYEISLNMKTPNGMETYGCFNLGNNEQFAHTLYKALEGDQQISEASVITIDLVRRENGIPFLLDLRHCSYEQLSNNVKLITKELFKNLNLEI